MAAQSPSQAVQLAGIARSLFGPLNTAEVSLLFAAAMGQVATCGPSANPDDPLNDPAKASNWGPERQIHSGLIRWLCADRQVRDLIDPKGIQIAGARLVGDLDLSSLTIPFGLLMSNCLTQAISIRATEIPELNLIKTWVDSIQADDARIRGHILLRSGFRANGVVHLLEAQIGGNLDCSNGTFKNPLRPNVPESGSAILADGAIVGGSVHLTEGFHAEGQVSFSDSEIAHTFECSGGTFRNPPLSGSGATNAGTALSAERVRVGGSLLLNQNFSAEGRVDLVGAVIEGILDSKGSTFRNPYDPHKLGSGTAILADRALIKGGVQLLEGARIYGQARFLNAQVGGSFQCSGALFSNPSVTTNEQNGPALDLSKVKIDNNFAFDKGSISQGEMRLLGAQIGGDLECSQAKLTNPLQIDLSGSGMALWADGATVGGSLSLHNGFRASGQVRLNGVTTGGSLNCVLAEFENPPAAGQPPFASLVADRATVGGSVFFNGARLAGDVHLLEAQVRGDIECQGAEFGRSFLAEGATIKGNFMWMNIQHPELTTLDLIDASVTNYGDDEKSWPRPKHLALDGFIYRNISSGPTDAESRLRWLNLQEKFRPQPYSQLAKVMMESGDDSGAKAVLVEKERLERQGGFLTDVGSDLLDATIGYGYYPWNLLRFWGPLAGLSWVLFRRAKLMTPTDESAYQAYSKTGTLPPHYPRFYPFIYSIENLLPLVKLGQADKWQPDPKRSLPLTRIILWACVILGWVFATLLVAALTGIIHTR